MQLEGEDLCHADIDARRQLRYETRLPEALLDLLRQEGTIRETEEDSGVYTGSPAIAGSN